jgi:hypothetical protein
MIAGNDTYREGQAALRIEKAARHPFVHTPLGRRRAWPARENHLAISAGYIKRALQWSRSNTRPVNCSKAIILRGFRFRCRTGLGPAASLSAAAFAQPKLAKPPGDVSLCEAPLDVRLSWPLTPACFCEWQSSDMMARDEEAMPCHRRRGK